MSDMVLTEEQRGLLQRLMTELVDEPTYQKQARSLLMFDDGDTSEEIAATLGLDLDVVQLLRVQFSTDGLAVFPEAVLARVTNAANGHGNGMTADDVEDAVLAAPTYGNDDDAPIAIAAALDDSDEETPNKVSTTKTTNGSTNNSKDVGMRPGDTLAMAARMVLRYHYAKMLAHEEGSRKGNDIEAVHDMRVAVRRQRAAFAVFADAFDAKERKRYVKGLRAITAVMGPVRDMDVFMEKAHAYLDGAGLDGDGLSPLVDAWQAERAEAREKMVAFFDSDDYAGFKKRYGKWLAKDPAADGDTTMTMRAVTPVMIYQRMAELRAYDSKLDVAPIDTLHALRLVVKRLRYTVEFVREILGPEAVPFIEETKVLQDHLGDLNDADVAVQFLNGFLQTWDDSQQDMPHDQRKDPQTVIGYLGQKHSERHDLLRTFAAAWQQFNREENRRNLALAVSVL